MDFRKTAYYKTGKATDLSGADRWLYRFFEIVPGAISWITILGVIILARYFPIGAAVFIIVFDLYWLLKTIYLSLFLRANWKRVRHNIALDWGAMLENLRYGHIHHLVILPFYRESADIIEKGLDSILSAQWDPKKLIIVLAGEGRTGDYATTLCASIQAKYADKFGYFISTIHPADIPGEMPGKGSNISYAAEQARIHVLDKNAIPYEHVLVSAFDIDTVVYPKYFQCLTWHFLTAERPFRSSYQPVPFFNNNIWDAPALSRVVATSGTFWQMIQQERPERLATFSSHALPFKTLYEIGYWQKNMVSEDSRIFWNALLAFDGDYQVVPMSYPVSMDANLAETFWQTTKNVYKQQRRWTWGVENVPYLLMGFVKNKRMSLVKKIRFATVQLEGFWSLVTHPLIIFMLGWLPLLIGGREFNTTLVSYNLPFITRYLMTFAAFGLVLSAIISYSFLPPMPRGTSPIKKAFMVIQWLLVPITIIIFGAIPGLDAQTRLMTGRYMGFWVTPKHRKPVTQPAQNHAA